jgi:hypothetical protein
MRSSHYWAAPFDQDAAAIRSSEISHSRAAFTGFSGQGEVAQMVGGELQLPALGRTLQLRQGHDPGVVHQNVQRPGPAGHEVAHRGLIGEVQARDRDLGAELGGDLLPRSHVPDRERHLSPGAGQGPGSLDPNARGASGDRLAEAADTLLAAQPPERALRQWMDLFVDYLATKHGMGDALKAILTDDGDRMRTRYLLADALGRLIAAGVEQARSGAAWTPTTCCSAWAASP